MNDLTAKFSRENSVKMLLTTSPTGSTTTTINSGLPSPTGDYSLSDENPNKLITYLHQIAGNNEVEVNVIMKDHCYARPWNWKPENVYVKPVKKLFFSKTQNAHSSTNQEEFIDVEEGDPEPIAPLYDLTIVQQFMDELKNIVESFKLENTDDWEEKIDKLLWSPVQNRVFSKVVRILNSEQITRLAKSNNPHEPVLRRTSINITAKRFREILASANWDLRITQWLHHLLLEYLPQEYLIIYFDVLQTLRQKIPQLIDKMITVQPSMKEKGITNRIKWEMIEPVLKKSWDPVSPILNANKPKKLPGNPILIIAPSGMSNNISSRQHKWITQLGNLGTVFTVNPHLNLTANKQSLTMIAGIEQLVQSTRAKIQDVRVDFPGRPIVLVGFNSGAALACQVGQLEHITAVVCLGFPFITVDGKRGSPDDTLLDVRCPVMFIIGQNAMLTRVDDIEDLREHMLVPTSLVVVGSADDHLRISTSKKISEKITQGIVDRCILDEIADFVGGILLQPHPLPLRSPSSINNYENRFKRVDCRKRKTSTSSSVESEPQSSNMKKLRPQSPQQGIAVGNNGTSISTNVMPRGTLVTLTGTTATQTPRRKPRANYANQNFSDHLITSRLTAQNLENSSGGITLNIGSFASLAPVGPIRFEPTSISLQGSPAGKPGNTLKTPNTFIKVSKNNQQVNIAGQQNVAKIKMIMPTKKGSQRTPNNYKNVNITEKTGDMNMVNVLTPTNSTPLRVAAPTATVTNIKSTAGNLNVNTQSNVQQPKNLVNASGTVAGKSATSSSVLFTPKNASIVTTAGTTATTTSTTPTKGTA